MSLWFLIAFYLIIAGCEISFPQKCLYLFEKVINDAKRIRLLSILVFLIAFLYHAAEPTRLQWLIVILFWVYFLSGISLAMDPQSFVLLCTKNYTCLGPSEKRAMLYFDCTLRTLLGLLLTYSI
jgi:hypothetical protein